MTDAQARNVVILGGLVSAGAITVGAISKGSLPKPRRLLAGGVVFIALAAIADTQPRLAGPMTGLVTAGIVLANGADALAGVQKGVSSATRISAKDVQTDLALDVVTAGDAAKAGVITAATPSGGPVTVPGPTRGAAGTRSAPVAGRFKIIGTPYAPGSTHTRGNWESDNALDIACPLGTPILACVPGKIGSQIGPLDSSNPAMAGLRVHVDGGGHSFYYAHLSRLSVRAGQSVVAGQVIGYSGSANGVAHLHFAVAPPERPQSYYS